MLTRSSTRSQALFLSLLLLLHSPIGTTRAIKYTQKTWKEVDFVYTRTIKGKQYTNTIQLLRPTQWLKKHNIDEVGKYVTLSMPESGIEHISVLIQAIKANTFNPNTHHWSAQSNQPVIGRSIRYVTDVRTYTFKDKVGHIFHIHATPKHPFYVQNKHRFVAIEKISDSDELLAFQHHGFTTHHTAHLVCKNGSHSHCGIPYHQHNLPIAVYNLTIYQHHNYYAGKDVELLVHNTCYHRLSSKEKFDKLTEMLNHNGPTSEVLIGQGAEGKVWQIDPHWVKKTGNMNALRREHGNWLRIYGRYSAYLHDESAYFRYIEGENLYQVLKAKSVKLNKIKQGMNTVLTHINKQGLRYHDINPGNFIFSREDNTIWAIDLSEVYPGTGPQAFGQSKLSLWKALGYFT